MPDEVLKVATSVLAVPEVAPGATLPPQFEVSDQLPLTEPVFDHVWLAANTPDGAKTKTDMAAARN